ncbi:thiamine phosphate synthase, partial [Mesorhizobium sp. M1E.F.Ca.ET.063.01.1.1]|uniref:thiamine phosphate synthase n=1 Tax=Mesorhizobium sp. M1E.F.Ca.ET.063.01.1.1 TaxID=2496750 RepID=UPI001FDEB1EF
MSTLTSTPQRSAEPRPLFPTKPTAWLSADVKAIGRAGLKLGLSTHDDAELETALQAEPDYVALGPIYPTILKAMK